MIITHKCFQTCRSVHTCFTFLPAKACARQVLGVLLFVSCEVQSRSDHHLGWCCWFFRYSVSACWINSCEVRNSTQVLLIQLRTFLRCYTHWSVSKQKGHVYTCVATLWSISRQKGHQFDDHPAVHESVCVLFCRWYKQYRLYIGWYLQYKLYTSAGTNNTGYTLGGTNNTGYTLGGTYNIDYRFGSRLVHTIHIFIDWVV